jgi:serralysin
MSSTPRATKLREGVNGGVDTVRSAISYTLADNFENLVLTGALGHRSSHRHRQWSDNTITGNAATTFWAGGVGNDILSGGKGLDTLTGGTGADLFVFAYGRFRRSERCAGSRHGSSNPAPTTSTCAGLDTNPNAGGVQIARFVGSQAFQDAAIFVTAMNAAHNVTVLEADFNGDKIADFGIELTGKLTLDHPRLCPGQRTQRET